MFFGVASGPSRCTAFSTSYCGTVRSKCDSIRVYWRVQVS